MLSADIRVGVAQIDSDRRDQDNNLAKHLAFIESAQKEGIDLLVFPELSISGYPQDGDDINRNAMFRDSEQILQLARAAGSMYVMAGFIEEAVAAQFYNATMLLHEGQLIHLHRKSNLATYGKLEEGKYFATGHHLQPVDLSTQWRLSSLICADLWNPALVHLAALHGTTLLIGPMNSAHEVVSSEFSNPNGWRILGRFYAMIYGLPLVLANRIGVDGPLTFWGGSRIVDPFGEDLAHAGEGEELLVAELKYENIRAARLQLPTVRDSNLALVIREITRLNSLVGVPDSPKVV